MDKLGYPYLPYMWGALKTYHEQHGRNPGDWEWIAPVYRYGDPGSADGPRGQVNSLLQARLDAPIDVLGLSCYTWNWRLQCAIGEVVKTRYPECLVVAGGPQPDFANPDFFREHPFIDAIALKDGEITFSRILDALGSGAKDLSGIRGLCLPAPEGKAHRFTGPTELPTGFEVSHYLAQADYYEQIIRECRGRFCATWETSRGCPFACSFCDWGSNTMSKVRRFDPRRVDVELDWLARNGVPVLFLSDANFGTFREDVELGRKVADAYRKYGSPGSFSYNTAKNKPEPSVAISKALFDSGMPYKHILSIQHTRAEVLAATDRKNISTEKQIWVVREMMKHGIPIEVQLILGIPGDTYALLQGCFGDLMEWGIHGQYQTYLYHLLPNAPAASVEFRRRWRIGAVERSVYLSPHMGLIASESRIVEKNDIVVSSATYGREDWVRMNAYAAVIKALHTSGLTQLVAHYLRRTHGVSYELFYSTLVDEWAAQTWWYQRVTVHFRAFLDDADAIEFLAIEELPSYPHPVAAFQWVFVQACLSLNAFFEALSRYLLEKYPRVTNLASLLRYQKNILILPEYDNRIGKTFITDLDWAGYFLAVPGEQPVPEPFPGSGGQVRVADNDCSDGINVFPLDWFDLHGEARWARWIDRVVLDYSCLSRGTFQNATLDSATREAMPARTMPCRDTAHTVSASMSAVTPHQAVEIVRLYTELIAKTGLDGKTVVDTVTLSHPKPRILASAALLNTLSTDPSERAALATMARALAFFQPNLEGTRPDLSSMGPNGQTWESIVCAEMQSIDGILRPASAGPTQF